MAVDIRKFNFRGMNFTALVDEKTVILECPMWVEDPSRFSPTDEELSKALGFEVQFSDFDDNDIHTYLYVRIGL